MTTTYEAAAATYRPILDKIAERAVEAERTRALPHEQIGWLREAGFGAARIPVELGGDGLTWPEYSRLLVDLAAADSNILQALRGHIALVEDQLFHHPGQDRSRWISRFVAGQIAGNAWTEPGAGGVSTTLDDGPAGLTVTGRKYYTTGSIYADWIDVTARGADGTDLALIVAAGADGVTTTDDWDGFGQRLTGSGTTVFDQAPVEPDAVFPFAGRFPYQTALYQHVHLITLAGIARAAARDAADEVRARTRTFGHGNGPRVRQDPQVLQVVGEIEATSFAAEALVQHVAGSLEAAYASRGAGLEEQRATSEGAELATAQGQVVLSASVPRAATAIFDGLGASATSTTKALDRHWRNARTVATHNPAIYKARVVGDWAVNGAAPPTVWSIGVQPVGGEADSVTTGNTAAPAVLQRS
ncbi:acyl-CoA dehydrogenase family protein [Actinotalea sp. BY-33]|uniref:Acyl-CoA dehydrogenase family protein n=1 Tax=Actinotalea soli TaxID=2819234 RepID=A0A939LR09_9CELL|nr:acyl-CoA dehydrogenase family protein [Actinotalea soli]MBO1752931.1 acyl-CoA dehydrogenase family protein [Actinotalea soli]